MADAGVKTSAALTVPDAREVRDVPVETERHVRGRPLTVDELFAGAEYQDIRQQIITHGRVTSPVNGKTLHVRTRPLPANEHGVVEHEILAVAAVSRDPGRTQDYIDTLQDFLARNRGASQRQRSIQQNWTIYETEGLINNAVNKYASLLSVGGRVKVRKAKKGKKQSAMQDLQEALDHWARWVNGPTPLGVATSNFGLQALTEQAMRVALVEGNWVGRQVWGQHPVGTIGSFKMPMVIQTISMEYLEPFTYLGAYGEAWIWKPPTEVVQLIKGETVVPKELKDIVKRLYDNEIAKQIKANDQAILTSALLSTVKHRGSDRSPYGESYLEPAKLGIRYSRAVTNTDMVSMESVINRLMIVMVGTSDPDSPYSKADVAMARHQLMQSFFEESGPSMTIVWQGDDVKIESKGAMDNLLDLEKQHRIGDYKMKIALGIPEAILLGVTSEGQAAGWASLIAAGGMAEHLGGAFARVWTVLAMRIAQENGYTDVDLVFEYDRSNLADKEAERNQNRQDYLAGTMSIFDTIAAQGRDPWAVYRQRCLEKGLEPAEVLGESPTWEEVFLPPQGLAGQGDGAPQGQGPGKTPGGGRTPENEGGTSEPAKPKRERSRTQEPAAE